MVTREPIVTVTLRWVTSGKVTIEIGPVVTRLGRSISEAGGGGTPSVNSVIVCVHIS